MKLIPRNFMKDRAYISFFISQMISGFGDTFQLLAVTTVLLKTTGSGLMAGFGVLCSSLPSIFLSLFAGSIGDKLPVKRVLVCIDVLRGIVSFYFIFSDSIIKTCILMVILSTLDIFYSPSRNRLITNVLKKEDFIMGNSVLSGGYGIIYVIGSSISAFVINSLGTDIAFMINSLSFFFCAGIIYFVRLKCSNSVYQKKIDSGIIKNISAGLKYCINTTPVKNIIFITTMFSFVNVSINLAFYSFFFDTLKLDSSIWGIMLSILYGMNLVAMSISVIFRKKISKSSIVFAYTMLFIIAAVWYLYGHTSNLTIIFILLSVEGTASSLCSIYLSTCIQSVARKDIISRVFGANDLMNSTAKLLGVALTYTAMKFYSLHSIFTLNSFILCAFVAYNVICHTFFDNSSRLRISNKR